MTKILHRAKALSESGYDFEQQPTHFKSFFDGTFSLKEYLALDEGVLLTYFQLWITEKDSILAEWVWLVECLVGSFVAVVVVVVVVVDSLQGTNNIEPFIHPFFLDIWTICSCRRVEAMCFITSGVPLVIPLGRTIAWGSKIHNERSAG